jgi:head-tail adaptor
MLNSGRNRWKARVSRATTSTDSLGRRQNTFTTAGYLRCDIRENGSAEQVYADGVAVVGSWEVRCRWQDIGRLTITELDRLTVRSKLLRIESIVNLDERDRVAVIQCREVV